MDKQINPENLESYKLNKMALDMISRIKDSYSELSQSKTILMNLKVISRELNNITIEEIGGRDDEV